MAKRQAPRRFVAARTARIQVIAPPPIRGGSQASTLVAWADVFEDTAERLREAAAQLERMGDFCRVCDRVVRQGVDAVPLLLEHLGARLQPEARGLLALLQAGAGGSEEGGDSDRAEPEARAG